MRDVLVLYCALKLIEMEGRNLGDIPPMTHEQDILSTMHWIEKILDKKNEMKF